MKKIQNYGLKNHEDFKKFELEFRMNEEYEFENNFNFLKQEMGDIFELIFSGIDK